MKKYKKIYKLDITEIGGVSEVLKNAYISLFKKADYYLLVEEGGEGTNSHYHLHGILSSNYKRTCDFRRKVLKPMYEELDKEITSTSVKVKEVNYLQGALSYIYKERKCIISSGILLKQIKVWKSKSSTKTLLKEWTVVRRHNYVTLVVSYCVASGVSPSTYHDLRNVMSDMCRDHYMFSSGSWSKSVVGMVLIYFGDSRYCLSCWDFLCDIPS